MPKLSESLEKFFQERLELILQVMKLAKVSSDNGQSTWRIEHSRSALNDTAIYHLGKLANMHLVEKEAQGRNIVAWIITGPMNLPEMIKDQIRKLNTPVVTELEEMVLEQGEKIVHLEDLSRKTSELLDVFIQAYEPTLTNDPVILTIHGQNTTEEIIATLQAAKFEAVRKTFAAFINELKRISCEFSGMKDQDLKEMISLLESLLNSEGSKKVGTARREIVEIGRHYKAPPSIEILVRMMEILVRFLHPPVNGVLAANGK
ncbi:MAG: hypothetical protein Q8L36_02905 [bacterium]|nr:hypothetical protein [bacterium]